jgi:hypothetical protein
MKFKKIKTRTNKKQTKRYKRSKKYTKKRYFKKGGEYNDNDCPDSKVECKWLDQQFKGKLNPSWSTCISMNGIYNHIIYLLQKLNQCL